MIRRNSTYMRLWLPVMCVLLMQCLLIGGVLYFNGTLHSLEDSAIDNLKKNVENRSITLEAIWFIIGQT